jgi:hypothetical protein
MGKHSASFGFFHRVKNSRDSKLVEKLGVQYYR